MSTTTPKAKKKTALMQVESFERRLLALMNEMHDLAFFDLPEAIKDTDDRNELELISKTLGHYSNRMMHISKRVEAAWHEDHQG